MDTNRIRYFLSLARTGSITKAAEFHRISPAAFSKAMRVFEAEVGEDLTIPQGRGLVLTDYAKSIVPSLESIIQQIDAVKERKSKGAANGNVLRVATFEVFSTYFMTKAIGEFFLDEKCEVYEMIPGKMEEAVATGRADLAITYIPIPHPDLDFMKVIDIEMGVFGHLKLPNSTGATPFAAPVSPIEGSPNKVRGLDGWPDDAFPRDIQFHVQMLETALGLCREGVAVAYVPKFIAKLHNKIVLPELRLEEIPLPKSFPRKRDSVFLIKRKSDHEGVQARKLARAIRKICQ